MYSQDFAANGSDVTACQRWPVRDLCSDFPSYCDGNLGKQRCEMPQMPSAVADQENFAKWKSLLAYDAIEVTESVVTFGSVANYLPSEKFMHRCKVCSIAFSANQCVQDGRPDTDKCKKSGETGCFCFWRSSMSVTEDGYILDGHHRWAASKIMLGDKLLPAEMTSVVELYSSASGQPNATVARIIETANKHPMLIKHHKCSAEQADDSEQ